MVEQENKKKMISVIACVLFVIFAIIIFNSWCDIFYQLGGHVYHWLNG